MVFSILKPSPHKKTNQLFTLNLSCQHVVLGVGLTGSATLHSLVRNCKDQQLHITLSWRSSDCYIADIVLTPCAFFFSPFFFFFLFYTRAFSACVSFMSWWMKQRQARRWRSRGTGLRCEQVCGFTAMLEWEQFQVHSCGVWFTLIYIHAYI